MKIGNIRLVYSGEHPISHEIHYKKGYGFHIKGMSAEFIGMTSFDPCYYETEAALVAKVSDACRLYIKLKTKSSLVILYKCEASPILTHNRISDDSYQGYLKGISSKIADTGFGSVLASFGIDFKLAQMIDDGTSKKYYKVDKITKEVSQWEIKDTNKYQAMEYTEERLEFFNNIVESMKKMVLSASTFFGVDPDVATLLIDNKQKFLN